MIITPTKVIGRIEQVIEVIPTNGVRTRVTAKAVHDVFGSTKVRVKSISGKRMANELIAAALSPYLGVKVPRCFLVRVDGTDISAEHRYDGCVICFASEVVHNAVDLASNGRLANPLTATELFSTAWWQAMTIFDAAIGNSDRTSANILMGPDMKFWAIDHETAFGGDWDLVDLVSARHATNLLAQVARSFTSTECGADLRRLRIGPQPNFESAVYGLPDVGLLSELESIGLLLYLKQRWANLDAMIQKAFFGSY